MSQYPCMRVIDERTCLLRKIKYKKINNLIIYLVKNELFIGIQGIQTVEIYREILWLYGAKVRG